MRLVEKFDSETSFGIGQPSFEQLLSMLESKVEEHQISHQQEVEALEKLVTEQKEEAGSLLDCRDIKISELQHTVARLEYENRLLTNASGKDQLRIREEEYLVVEARLRNELELTQVENKQLRNDVSDNHVQIEELESKVHKLENEVK